MLQCADERGLASSSDTRKFMFGSELTFVKSPNLMNVLFILPGVGTEEVKLNFTADQAPFSKWPGTCRAVLPAASGSRHWFPLQRLFGALAFASSTVCPAWCRDCLWSSWKENPQIQRRALCRRRERSRS